ncbi:MAG: murein biosynthesis integral membrane protein MurJ [Defluviitaleaceae bacterium]|nr:murein biosynthesis integral membrane protein MurJ [Defluviitaleaceae bacterium]
MAVKDSQISATKTISVVMVLVVFAKISGLLRNMVIMSLLGTQSTEAAAFTFASFLPRNFLDAAFAAAISAGFIPVFNKVLEQKTKEEAFDLARNFITFVGIVSLAVSVIGFFSVQMIAGVHFGADEVYATYMGAGLLQIMIFTMFFTSIAFALVGLSQSLGGFYIPSLMSLLSNVVIIAYLLLFFEDGGVTGLAFAFVIGNILQVLIFWLPLRRRGFFYRPKLNLKDEGLRQILRLTPMVMVSSWLFPLTAMLNGALAARANPAYFVELEAASVIYLVLTGMFILSVTNVVFPKLSKEAARDDEMSEFRKTLTGAVSGMTFLLLPMSAGIFILREPIVRLLFERGEFTPEATSRAAFALGILAVSIIGYGLVSIMSRAFFATRDGKTPMFITIAAIVLNFLVVIGFVEILGIGGPALAAAVSVNFAGFVMYGILAKRLKILDKPAALNFAKMLLCTAIMLLVLIFIEPLVSNWHDIFSLALITILGVAIYFVAAVVLGIKEAGLAKSLIFGGKGAKDE